MTQKRILTPSHTVIEHTAAEIAGAFYEQGRSLGLKSKHKTARAYAKANFVKFIPKAVEILTEMLGRNDIHENIKRPIYEAIMERANDPDLAVFDRPKDNVDIEMDRIKNLISLH